MVLDILMVLLPCFAPLLPFDLTSTAIYLYSEHLLFSSFMPFIFQIYNPKQQQWTATGTFLKSNSPVGNNNSHPDRGHRLSKLQGLQYIEKESEKGREEFSRFVEDETKRVQQVVEKENHSASCKRGEQMGLYKCVHLFVLTRSLLLILMKNVRQASKCCAVA